MWLKKKIKNWLLKHLFDAVTDNDFFVVKGHRIYYKGREIDKNDYRNIAVMARELKQNDVLKAILKELKYLAKEKIFYNEDIEFGKALLYNINLIELKIEQLSNADRLAKK